jgi:hypothetical protein
MVKRWLKVAKLQPGQSVQNPYGPSLEYDKGWGWKLGINAFGALLTAGVTVVFSVSKFSEGAWITVIVIPLVMATFWRINAHYKVTARVLSLANIVNPRLFGEKMIGVVFVENTNRATLRAIRYMETLGIPYYLFHVSTSGDQTAKMLQRWEKYKYKRSGFVTFFK